jgi:hypothetical protein
MTPFPWWETLPVPRFNRLFASVIVLTLLALAALGQPPAAGRKTVSGTVTKAHESQRRLEFETVENGPRGPKKLADVYTLARDCRVTLDGKRATLGELLPGYAVTIEVDTRLQAAVAIAAESFEAKAAKKKRAFDRDLAEEKIKKEINKELVAAATRRAAEVRAAWEAKAQEYALRNMPAAAGWKPGTTWTPTQWSQAGQWAQQQPTFGKPNNEAGLVLLAFLGAALSDGFARNADADGDILASVFWRLLRDGALDAALDKSLPDAPAAVRRAARRIISQFADGELSLKNFKEETALEEALEALAAERADLKWAPQLGAVVYQFIKANRR